MAKESAHARLLREAKARERAAGKKVSRLKQVKGIDLHIGDSGKVGKTSRPDPRVGADKLNQMTTRELKAHVEQVNRFVSRDNAYVRGFGGTAIPKSKADVYKQLEAQNNNNAQAVLGAIGNVQMLDDQTIAERTRRTTPDNPGGGVGRIFQKINRDMSLIVDEAALDKLTAGLAKKTSRDYYANTVKARLNSLDALLEYSDNEDFIADVHKLSRAQQLVLLDYSTFGEIAKERFSSGDTTQRDTEDEAYFARTGINREDSIRDELREVLDWVKKEIKPNGQPRNASTVLPPRNESAGYTNTNAGQFSAQFNPRDTRAGKINTVRDAGRSVPVVRKKSK